MASNTMINVTVLGSTGSIGKNTLDVLSRHTDKYKVTAITANKNTDLIFEQCEKFNPDFAVMADVDAASDLKKRLSTANSSISVLVGEKGLSHVASIDTVDCVVAGIVGAAGLVPTLMAAQSGKRVLLANKESLVMSGQLFMDTVADNSATLVPVDSEHNAIFQCIPTTDDSANKRSMIKKIMLTASGGPFREIAIEKLSQVTPEQAVAHPKWTMGHKISVDSATMMNKGLEVIEAVWLFGVKPDDIEVVIHPQSIIHSMVSYVDGSVLAQLGNPDMRTPIAHALAWPERIESGVEPLDIFDVGTLDFEKPDIARFPCLKLCYDAIANGGSASIILNAANEIAVDEFLNNKIKFTAIAEVVEQTMRDSDINDDVSTLDLIIEADQKARALSHQLINKYHH